MGNIEDLMIELVKKGSNNTLAQIVWGTAINITETSCKVVREDAPDIEDVLLNAIDDVLPSHCTVYPKEGSMVLAGIIEGIPQMAVILKCSQVDKIVIKAGQNISIQTQTGISLHAGTGKIEIKNEVNSLADILGNLIDTVSKISVDPNTGIILPASTLLLEKIGADLKLLMQ
jgi:hypothetical protein